MQVRDDPTLKERTKLTPDDIENLLKLCLTTSQFVFDGVTYSANDSGPIGLSLMTTISDFWMTHTLKEASNIATQNNLRLPKFIKKYVDDIFAIFRKQPLTGLKVFEDFLSCLNQVHP